MIKDAEIQGMIDELRRVLTEAIAVRCSSRISRVSIKWTGVAQFSNVTGQRVDDRAVPDIAVEFEK